MKNFIFITFLFNLVAANLANDLNRFQSAKGGFSLKEGEEPTVEATSRALFLSSLFGLHKKIDSNGVSNFLQTIENGDFGFGKKQGLASDLESVRYAVLSYKNLGLPIPNSGKIGTFIKTLFDKNSNLFANRLGEKGDLRSTYFAFDTLELLDVEREFQKSITPAVLNYLRNNEKTSGVHSQFLFPKETQLSQVSANAYGILLGKFVEYNFENFEKWSSFIVSHQSSNGGFVADAGHKTSSLADTANSMNALYSLSASLVNHVNNDALVAFAKQNGVNANDLRSIADGFLIIARSNQFANVAFDVATSFESLDAAGILESTIIQGTRVKPVISVKAGGVSHGGLSVSVSMTVGNKQEKKSKLQWKEESQVYVAEDLFESANLLGKTTFEFTVERFVAETGLLKFTVVDLKQIGYGISLNANANLAGTHIKVGDAISMGTELSVGVSLFTQGRDNIISGDFDVVFSVVDSSNVVIHSQTLNAKPNKDAISFKYALKNANIPSGQLSCVVSLRDHTLGEHSSKSVSYEFAANMIATQTAFASFKAGSKPTYKLGETVRVSIVPANFPDLRTVHPLSSVDSNNKVIVSQRRFVVDIKSVGGVTLHSVQGQAVDGKYEFAFPIRASLENVGTHIVSFRYVPVNGESISLGIYDAAIEELVEDANSLTFTVDAELQMTNVIEEPKGSDFFYGNQITFKFSIVDSVSKKQVIAENPELSNVFLALKHSQANRQFTSANQSATHFFDEQGNAKGFLIFWNINANAVSGEGQLTLAVRGADGNIVNLYKEGSRKEIVKYNVKIDGQIDVNHSTYTSVDETNKFVFLVNFDLKCKNKPLNGAQLSATIVTPSGEVQIPVATTENGYVVSYTLDNKLAVSGSYTLKVDRLDRQRGESTTLFETTLNHKQASSTKLPIKIEFIAAFASVAAIFYFKRRYSI